MAHSDKGFAAATTAVPALATATDPMAGMERDIRDAAVASVRAAFTGDQTKATEASNPAADAIAKAQNHEQHIEVLFPKQSSRLPKLPKRSRPQFRPVRSWGSSPSQCRGGSVGTTHLTRDDDIYVARCLVAAQFAAISRTNVSL
ncbi:hypothetical protein AB4Z25_13585 [Rhizobium sp. RAF36]|uniref:hypothetical protein n=1 Tax=Rhizobium sp. RAF36 TaxID=3233055 RepID=UPI003F9B9228